MRYLFFDIECCNGRDMCEFGYVITDSSFKTLVKNVITIDPESKFNLIGRPHSKDVYLFYTDEYYYNSPTFPTYYQDIKRLIEHDDQIIVGHAINNDADFINIACKRYGLDPINFRFNDSQKMYKEFFGESENVSLSNAGEKLAVEFPDYLHKSDDDSELTMKLVQSMCNKLNVTLAQLIEMCPTCSGESKDFEITYDVADTIPDKWTVLSGSENANLMKKGNKNYFKKFLQNVTPQQEIQSTLKGKAVCISTNYEHFHFKEMLAIAQRIVDRGGTYTQKVAQCNIFVSYTLRDEEGEERPCVRLDAAHENIDNGMEIEIITFEQLMQQLDTTEKELALTPYPPRTDIAPTQSQQDAVPKRQGLTITIGELIQAEQNKRNNKKK